MTSIKKLREFLQIIRIHAKPLEFIRNSVRVRFADNSSLLRVRIRNCTIHVRPGTADFLTAETNLWREFEHLRPFSNRLSGMQVLDAGGYIGTSTLALRAVFPDLETTTVEPSSQNLALLRLNTKNMTNLRTIHGALASGDGEVEVFSRKNGEIGNTIIPSNSSEGYSLGLKEVVQGYSLSRIVDLHGPIGVLKLDIEGAEKAVFEKSKEILATIPIIVCELHDRIEPGCTKALMTIIKEGDIVSWNGEKVTIIRESLLKKPSQS